MVKAEVRFFQPLPVPSFYLTPSPDRGVSIPQYALPQGQICDNMLRNNYFMRLFHAGSEPYVL